MARFPIRSLAFAAAWAAAALTFGSPVPEPQDEVRVSVTPTFAWDLYAELRGDRDNVVLSPFSVTTAFMPLVEGSRGATRTELERGLRLEGSWEASRPALAALQRALGARESAGVSLEIANGVWIARRFALLPAFLGRVKSDLDARVVSADFHGDPRGVESEINRFVADATRGMIPQLVEPGSVAPDTRLYVANAVYFKGTWAKPFDRDATQPLPFHGPAGRTTTVPFMQQQDGFRYYEDDSLRALEMGYRGGKIAMVVLLPRADDGLLALERRLDGERLQTLFTGLGPREVHVLLPRFKVETSSSLKPALEGLGIRAAFTEGADLSGMTGGRDLYVSSAIHRAIVEVNEEGTEAAAATGVGIRPTSALSGPPAVFRADHPFLFLIRDRQTGAVLFIGRVAKP